MIGLSTTTHNLFMFNTGEISSNSSENSGFWQKNTTTNLSYARLIQVRGCTVTRSLDQHRLCFHTRKKSLTRVHLLFCSRLFSARFDSQNSVFKAEDLIVTLEKRAISYLSVLSRIRVIDPFSQMKREYGTILEDGDSANRVNFVPSQSFT